MKYLLVSAGLLLGLCTLAWAGLHPADSGVQNKADCTYTVLGDLVSCGEP